MCSIYTAEISRRSESRDCVQAISRARDTHISSYNQHTQWIVHDLAHDILFGPKVMVSYGARLT